MMKNSYVKILSFVFIGLVVLYCLFLFALPKFLSSNLFKDWVDDIIYKKTGINIVSEHLKVKTYSDLRFKVAADSLKIDNGDIELLQTKNAVLTFDLKFLSLKKIDIDYIYINEKGFKDVIGNKKRSKKSKINLSRLPKIDIRDGVIWFDRGSSHSVYVDINNLKQEKQKDRTVYTFEAIINTDLLDNKVFVGKNGCIYYKDGALFAENFETLVGNSKLVINGKITDKNRKNTELTVKGDDIPVDDVMSSLLYFQKMKEPGKKFIENFYDYSGIADVDLIVNKNGLFGKCSVDKLAGNTVLFDVPILFPNVDFIFNEHSMKAEAYGLFGSEKVFSNVKISNIGTKDQEVYGTVHSVLTDKFADKYVPDFTIKGKADASVIYHIKNKIINVDYKLLVPIGSDVYFKTANLGFEDKSRRILVQTTKSGDTLKITNYDYSTNEDGQNNKIILGDGLFKKENGHLKPQYLTFKTQKDAPVSLTGSFYKYVQGGVFNGDLKYDFKKNKITGIFNIKNSKYKNFIINNADVNADDKKVRISADGLYNNSPFNCQIIGLNNFSKNIKIYNMNLFLNEYVLKPSQSTHKSSVVKNTKKVVDEVKKIDVDVDNWTIKINKIRRRRLVLRDINVNGDIHNNVFSYIVPKLNFAKGVITANGHYNYNNRTSEANIEAKNIDSEIVADVLFELPNQIEGIANGKIQAVTKNGIDDIKANVSFSVDNGFLPQLGSTEFMIKKSKMVRKPLKFKLEDVVNIDLKNMQALSSNLKGNFILDNHLVKDVHITSSQKFLALLIEGDYNIESQQADFSILGKYNKSQISKVKIMFMPLSLLLKVALHSEYSYEKYKEKLNEVPDIQGDDDDECAFRVSLNGNLNKNDVKVVMKRIK